MISLKRNSHLFFILFVPQLFMELLTTNLAPSAFFSLPTFIVLVVVYGFPALLITDAVARWKLSWMGFLILCFAYGLLNEGVVAKTFFDIYTPNHVGGSEGVFFGVNFPWIVSITSVHAFFSMFFPVLFVRALWPERVMTAFLSHRTRVSLVLPIAVVGAIIYFTTTDYSPVFFLAICTSIMIAMICIAKYKFSNKPFELHCRASKKIYPAILGFFAAPIFLIAPFIFAEQLRNWILLILVYISIIMIFISVVRWFGWLARPSIYYIGLGSYIGFSLVGLVVLSQGRIDAIVWNVLWIILFLTVLIRMGSSTGQNTER